MKSVTATPFRTANPDRVKCDHWLRSQDPDPTELEEAIRGLDYTSVLNVQRRIVIDVAGLRDDCGLPPDAPLSLSVSWTSGGTHLRRSLYRTLLPTTQEPAQVVVAGSIPAEAASGRLSLETKISLAGIVHSAHPLAATLPGSVLWVDLHSVSLDGSTSFFPIQLANFDDESATWTQPDAAWCLLWPALELDRPFLGSVKLLINSSHPRVASAVSGPARTKEAHAIRATIYFDVARTMMLGGLNNPEFIDCDGEYLPGSCGKAVHDLIRYHFPADKLVALRDTASSAPELFSADLQSKLRLFWSLE